MTGKNQYMIWRMMNMTKITYDIETTEEYVSPNMVRTAIGLTQSDTRYSVPKEEPKANDTMVDNTIEDTVIYRRAKELILMAQRRQVAYGIDKYPEPLNADTWTTIETIDHIIDESIDKLHYLLMLRIKMEEQLAKEDAEYCMDVKTAFNGADFDGDICIAGDDMKTIDFRNVISNTIKIGDDALEVLDNGGISVNGTIINTNEISSIELMQESINLLARSVISLAGGQPRVNTK